jgi:hypothetical protein
VSSDLHRDGLSRREKSGQAARVRAWCLVACHREGDINSGSAELGREHAGCLANRLRRTVIRHGCAAGSAGDEAAKGYLKGACRLPVKGYPDWSRERGDR